MRADRQPAPSRPEVGIDFVISNPGHHVAQIEPLFGRLRRHPGVRCRVLSLCELRGFATPLAAIRSAGADCVQIVPRWIRPSPSAGPGGGRGSARRRLSRALAWRLLLGPRLTAALGRRSRLAVLPNDAAFPYDRLAALMHRRGMPFVLLQEGIRFPLPATGAEPAYGSGGAVAVAAWGETSAEYFRRQGVPDERIFPTGNPRFDAIPEGQPRRRGGERQVLLLITNPIDDQGFCSTQQKLALFRRFVQGLAPLLDTGKLEVWVRPHGRESAESYLGAVRDLPQRRWLVMRAEGALHDLLTAADAVVVTASTAGLEALLFECPLGVLELPEVGFVYDYVQRGAALGLDWGGSLAEQVAALLGAGAPSRAQVHSYLARTLATRRDSAGLVSRLLMRCLREADAGSH